MTLRAIFVNAVFLARFPFDHGARSRSRAPWLAVIVYAALSRQTESGSNSKQNKALSRRSFPCETTTFTKNNFTEREYVKKSKFQWKKLQQQARNNLIKPRHTHTHVTVPCPACDKSWAAGRVPRVRSWLRVPPASFSAALPACSGPAMSSWRRAPSCGACALLRCRASLAARDCWGRGARRRWWGGPPASLRRLTLFRKRFNFFFLRSLVLYKLTRDRTAQPGRVVTVSSGSRVRISPAPVYYYMTFLSALCNAQLRRRLRCEAAIVKSSRNSKLLTRSWRPRSLRSRANRKKTRFKSLKQVGVRLTAGGSLQIGHDMEKSDVLMPWRNPEDSANQTPAVRRPHAHLPSPPWVGMTDRRGECTTCTHTSPSSGKRWKWTEVKYRSRSRLT